MSNDMKIQLFAFRAFLVTKTSPWLKSIQKCPREHITMMNESVHSQLNLYGKNSYIYPHTHTPTEPLSQLQLKHISNDFNQQAKRKITNLSEMIVMTMCATMAYFPWPGRP